VRQWDHTGLLSLSLLSGCDAHTGSHREIVVGFGTLVATGVNHQRGGLANRPPATRGTPNKGNST
jgi:hypothetical protein